jgi:uncharacterized protein YecE (DUF72 family)
MSIYIGIAGWNLPKNIESHFPKSGSHIERYSSVFNCVEINSSFYRDHKKETYVKWATMVPNDFRFSVKLSRYFTQKIRLKETGKNLKEILNGVFGLKEKLGILLVQLPPSLEFDFKIANKFMSDLKKLTQNVDVVWEPRHKSWGSEQAIETLAKYGMSKVLADPEPCVLKKSLRVSVEDPRYLRLHGSPEIYKTLYKKSTVKRIASSILNPISPAKDSWCIFDNTAYGRAHINALHLRSEIKNGNRYRR